VKCYSTHQDKKQKNKTLHISRKFWTNQRHRPVNAAGLFFLYTGLFSLRFGRVFNMYRCLFLMQLSNLAQRGYRKGSSLVHHLQNRNGETTQFVLCYIYIYIDTYIFAQRIDSEVFPSLCCWSHFSIFKSLFRFIGLFFDL